MKKHIKNILSFIVAASVGAGSMALYLFTRDLLGIEPHGWIAAILAFAAALIVSITIHEMGHLIAGKAVGFKFYMLTVGPFKIQRKGDRLQAGINKHLNIGGGLTIMMPETELYQDSDMVWFILGGPLGNFFFTLAFLAAIFTFMMANNDFAQTVSAYVLYTTAFISFLLGVTALLPANSDLFESDGTQLLDLKRGGDKAAIKQKLMVLTLSVWNGTRPRNIDKGKLDSLLEMTTGKTASSALTARLLSALYHLDSGQINEAEVVIDDLVESLEKVGNVILEGTVYAEKAFIAAAYRKDAETAQTYLDKARKGYTEDQTIARIEVALLILNRKIEEAKIRAKEGISAANESIDKGSAVFEKEVLKIMSEGKLPSE